MGNFIKENWIWIVAPIVLVLGLLVAIAFLGSTGDDSPFVYNIF